MKFYKYSIVTILVFTLFSSFILFTNDFLKKTEGIHTKENESSYTLLQRSYAIEEEKAKDIDDNKDDNTNNIPNKLIFNIVAVGDWDCTGETEDTVDNIIDRDPEIVLALGDFSYSGDADCWFDIIEPIADKTKIAMGNHEDADDYMDYFGLKEQYYSFNYKNVHILALSTEIDYDDDSEQYQFALKDLEK